MTLRGGTRLGAYEILAPLGAGGMGEVYRARDTRLGRDVAVKVLPEHLSLDTAARARFEREARAVAALSHPNILDIHDVGAEGGVFFVVTELLEGETLGQRLAGGPLPWRKAVETGLAVAEGLGAAHSQGVVHRDLKPGNIFLTADGRVKILDFGIATVEQPGKPNGEPAITETGALVGTAGYISPERIRHTTADARSDIFSFGCVLYEMLTGRRAFTGETAPEILVATLRKEPRDPADLVPGLSADLRLLVLRCLEKSPLRRFQSAGDLAFALKIAAGAPSAERSARGEPTVASPQPATRRRRVPAVALTVFAAAAAGIVLLSRRGGPGDAIDSLAVIPFANDTGNPDDEYLSDGITESLINSVSRLPHLTVMARTTVFRYRGEKDPARAGRELNVKAVLSGRVQRRGDIIVVQADLVDVRHNSQIWGDRFTDKSSNTSSLPGEIAQNIASSLRPRLTGEEKGRLTRRTSHDPAAYDLTLRGRYYLNKRTEEGIGKSLSLFQQALERDPKEALAWAGLADHYLLVMFYGMQSPKELLVKQREAALRAIQLDPTVSGAHASLADAKYLFEWDWKGAEEGFRTALELNPNDAEAHQWYSNFLTMSSRFEESFKEIRLARTLDPLSMVINTDVGTALYFAGDDDGAIAELKRTVEMDPSYPLAHIFLGLPQIRKGRFGEALLEFRKAVELDPGEPYYIAAWGYACARAGRPRDAEEPLKQLEALSKQRFVSSFHFAFLTLGLGDKGKALDWLEKAAEERESWLVCLRVEPAFDPVREEPRFRDLVRRIGIPPRS